MITSVSNAKVKQVVLWQEKAKERRKDQVFLAEGPKMFGEAPLSWIREVFVTETAVEKLKANRELLRKLGQVAFEEVSDEVMKKMADTQTPQGILTVLRSPSYDLEDLLAKKDGLFIILEDLQDPGNLGTIMRTSEGAGVTAVIMNKKTVDIFNPKVIRSTMGSVFRMKFAYVDIDSVFNSFRSKNIETYALALDKKAQAYDKYDYKKPSAFVIGNEGNGLKESTVKACDNVAFIPMCGSVESLNASVAASLMMYEIFRQRRNKK